MKKDISKRKTPFFCISKGLSNKQKKIFHVIYTLKQSHAKITERFNTQHFGVTMMPLLRENRYNKADV